MKKVGLVLLIAPVILLASGHVKAADANDIKTQITQIQNSGYSDIDKVTSMLDLYDSETKQQYEIQDKMSKLAADVKAKQKDYDNMDGQVKANQDKIKGLTTEINTVQADIDKQQDKLDKQTKKLNKLKKSIKIRTEQINDMYRSLQIKGYGQTGDLVSAILDAHSVTDAVANTFGVVKLNSFVKQQVTQLRDETEEQKQVKANIVKIRHQMETAKDSLTDTRSKTDNANRELVAKQNEITTSQNQIGDEIKDSDAQMKKAKSDAEEVQKQFTNLAGDLVKSEATIKDMISKTTDANKKKMLQDLLKRIDEIKPVTASSAVSSTDGSTPTTPSISNVDSNWTYDVKNLDASRKKLVEVAQSQLGVPYVWGGTTANVGLDCSGLTQYVYSKALGIHIDRVTQDQQHNGREVKASELKAGDLILWGEPAYHVGIYIGDGVYIHAPQPGETVKYSRYGINAASHIRRIIE